MLAQSIVCTPHPAPPLPLLSAGREVEPPTKISKKNGEGLLGKRGWPFSGVCVCVCVCVFVCVCVCVLCLYCRGRVRQALALERERKKDRPWYCYFTVLHVSLCVECAYSSYSPPSPSPSSSLSLSLSLPLPPSPSLSPFPPQVLCPGLPGLCQSWSGRSCQQSGLLTRAVSHTPSFWRTQIPRTGIYLYNQKKCFQCHGGDQSFA